MNDYAASVYLREISHQCRYFIGAVYQLNFAYEGYQNQQQAGDETQQAFLQGEVFRALHSLLNHAGHISRLLWPATDGDGAQARERGAALRARLDLGEGEHLLDSDAFRGYGEGFDRQLDDWLAGVPDAHQAEAAIGPLQDVASADERGVLRWYDPEGRQFVFLGREYDIRALVASIDGLMEKADKAAGEALEASRTEGL